MQDLKTLMALKKNALATTLVLGMLLQACLAALCRSCCKRKRRGPKADKPKDE